MLPSQSSSFLICLASHKPQPIGKTMGYYKYAVSRKAKFQQTTLEKQGRCRICKQIIQPGTIHPALLTPDGKCLARYCSENCRQNGEMRSWER